MYCKVAAERKAPNKTNAPTGTDREPASLQAGDGRLRSARQRQCGAGAAKRAYYDRGGALWFRWARLSARRWTIPMSNPVVLVYSNRAEVRQAVILGVGRRPARDVGHVDFLECATVAEVLMAVDDNAADLLILDGEAQPAGGMGVSRQIHLEAEHVPPVILLVRRRDDRWLATWAKADAVLMYPLDPVSAAEAVAAALRRRVAAASVGGASQ